MSTRFYAGLVEGKTVAESSLQPRCQVLDLAAQGKYPEKASFVHWGALTTFSRLRARLM